MGRLLRIESKFARQDYSARRVPRPFGPSRRTRCSILFPTELVEPWVLVLPCRNDAPGRIIRHIVCLTRSGHREERDVQFRSRRN